MQFKGKLVHLNGVDSLVQNIPLRLVDLGAGTTGTDGIFTIDINKNINEVTLELINSNSNIVYPTGGRAGIPKNPDTITEFIVGESTKNILTRAIAKSNNDFKNSLEQIGVKQDAIEETLNMFRNEIQLMTDIKVSDLKKEIDLVDKRTQFYSEISTSLIHYINEAKDIKDAFKFVSKHAFEDPQALFLLTDAVNNYNEAFEQLNKAHKGYEMTIGDLWQSEAKTAETRELLNYALGELHSANIFVLNLKLRDINDYFQGNIKKSEKRQIKERILKEIEVTELQLDRRLNELDKRTQIFLTNLKN